MVAEIYATGLAASLKLAGRQARERDAAEAARAATAGQGDAIADPGAVGDGFSASTESPAERDARMEAERLAERAAAAEREAQAEAFNDRLGAALVSSLSRVKVDARVMGVLLSVTVGDFVDQLAMRGARYGFPGWVTETQTAAGKTRREYLQHPEAGEKAREYLAGASTPGDYAGRALALVAMAVYADQDAVAMSYRVQHQVRATGTPWAERAHEILDELLAEQLPAGVLEAQLAERQHARDQEAQRQVDQRVAREQIAAALADPDAHTLEQLQACQASLDVAWERYRHDRFTAESALRRAIAAKQAAEADTTS